jgi:hypothetical protein
MKCEFGYCLNCEKEIAKKCSTCNKRELSSDYTEVLLNLSNGSRMVTAVCIACSKGPIWNADKQQLTEAIWKAWDDLNHPYDKTVSIVA